MPSIRLTPEAKRDLADIFRYSAKTWGLDQASQYTRAIDAALTEIASRPKAGRPRDNLLPGMRSRNVQRHVIYYRDVEDGIWVIRILHTAQDPDAAFPPTPTP